VPGREMLIPPTNMIDPRHLVWQTLVTSWGVAANKLTDDFRWVDELGHEDGGWFLREVRFVPNAIKQFIWEFENPNALIVRSKTSPQQ